MAAPTYLRVVVNAVCSMRCPFCHLEGDPAVPGARRGVSRERLVELVTAAVRTGVGKVKFLGGEPLLRADMPLIVEDLRTLHPHLDLSIITAGAVPPERLAACLDAGLSRANLSIHGWRIEAFRKNGGTVGKLAQRNGCLALLLGRGLPLKLNYVYGGPDCLADLAALLDFAADKPVVVNVLDDLQDSSAGSATVLEAVARLRGQPSERWTEPDPHSLPTLRLRWADGLLVEIKDTRLGDVAPWKACSTCPVRNQCREGIHALRLTHTGNLQPCMDRPELGRALAEVTGVPALAHEMNAWLREVA